MKKIISLMMAVIIILACLVSCESTTEEEYYTRTNRNSMGRVSISLSTISKDGIILSEDELKRIYSNALDEFTKAYTLLSKSKELGAVNANADVVLDTNNALTKHIKAAFRLSNLTDNLYQPAGGSLTSLFEKEKNPSAKALKEALSHVGCENIEFIDSDIKKYDSLCTVDLYSYCDGHALSAACEYLKDTPVAYGTVTFNGIAGVFGNKPESEPFAIEIGNGADGIFNITDGYVALVCEGFGSSYDFSDGKLEPALQRAAVYSPDPCTAAVMASVAYAHGSDSLLNLYEKDELKFEAVLTENDGSETYTAKAEAGELYTPITTVTSE